MTPEPGPDQPQSLATQPRRPARSARPPGFTLIELILVMALLVVILSVAAPSLAPFFRGRSLDSEARRFVALTRYAQSRAASESAPMILWIDPEEGSYGLQAESSYSETDRKAAQFKLAKDLQIEVDPTYTTTRTANPWKQTTQLIGKLPAIRFSPDGFISPTSPTRLWLIQGDEAVVEIGQSRNFLSYEIKTNQTGVLRR